ncbi:MAG: pyruvate kinase [Halanaerobium sp.]|nr:pyruvate kinase [Halanaerobium sp.]
MRRTKIVCTIGPASEDRETLAKLLEAGMNVARLNFSHGDHEEHLRRVKLLREVSADMGIPVALMLDTKGPEIRTGILEEPVILEQGQEFILTTEEIVGSSERISVSYQQLPRDLHPGSVVLLDDGLIELDVLEVREDEVITSVKAGGELSSRKSINIPGISVNLPALTDKDLADIKFANDHDFDFIAASFVRKREDVLEVKKVLESLNAEIDIISKIENEEGVQNIDEILEVSEGIMVARGDLGVEIPPERVPAIQKMIIKKCNKSGKPVITATQMLDSMIRNPRPTRAEASDVANAIYDGTDATMLSGESAIGSYPIKSVETMALIAEHTENSLSYKQILESKSGEPIETLTDAISHATCETALNLDAEAIITSTRSGFTARLVSKYRPKAPIIAATPSKKIMRKLLLVWGVYPIQVSESANTDEMIQNAVKGALDARLVKQGDVIVITAGIPVGVPGSTNLLKIQTVGEAIVRGIGIGKGAVTGKIKVAENAAEAEEKIEEGDILVTYETDKEFVPVLQKTGAIITECGGLTSHAAIVGLNLNIPVIVAVEDAMTILREGSIATVDSDRGLVYPGRVRVL